MGQRCMFINRTDKDVKINVFTHDQVRLYVLVSSPSANLQTNVQTQEGPGPFVLTIPRGTICGFSTEHSAAVENPSEENFDIHIANGNVPWPEPPPEKA
jgi:hypothetical protein